VSRIRAPARRGSCDRPNVSNSHSPPCIHLYPNAQHITCGTRNIFPQHAGVGLNVTATNGAPAPVTAHWSSPIAASLVRQRGHPCGAAAANRDSLLHSFPLAVTPSTTYIDELLDERITHSPIPTEELGPSGTD
jgi:hypothetical protein